LSTTRADGIESGGWLYAPASRSWDKEIEIRLASTPGKGARCAPESYFPSADYHAEEKQFADLGSDIVRVGDWHSHPGRNADPSDEDLDAWLKSFLVANEKRGVASYVGLIVAEDDSRSFVRAKFNAFALSYDRSGRVVCEPANLSIPGRN
jgi:proteasome lid subunit RPN8/RPN11